MAVVTGGVIGEARARMMAERGATVMITDVDGARAEEVAESVGAAASRSTSLRIRASRRPPGS